MYERLKWESGLNEKECNSGTTLVDITTFASVQNLLDDPKQSRDCQILDLCSLLDALVLSNRIVILEPLSLYKKATSFSYPDLLKELSSKCGTIERLESAEDRKIDDILLSLADEINSNKQEKRFLEQYSNDLDVVGYYKACVPTFLDRSVLRNLEDKGFSVKNGTVYGLGHEYRTREYLRCSAEENIPYYPHYIREPLVKSLLNKAQRTTLLAREYIRRIEVSDRNRSQALNLLKGINKFDLCFPAVPTYIASQCKDPSEIVDETVKLFKEPKARKFRNYMEQFERAILTGNKKESENYQEIIDNYLNSLGLNIIRPGYKLHSVPSVSIQEVTNPRMGTYLTNIVSLLTDSAEYVYKKLKRRHLTFLGAVAKNVGEIGSSKKIFEELFGKKIDVTSLKSVAEQSSLMNEQYTQMSV